MQIQTKLFSSSILFVLVISIFASYVFLEFDTITNLNHEIEEGTEISLAALDFNVENFHTQLEMWEYAYEPNQKRLDAFYSHKQTLDELMGKWNNLVSEEVGVIEEPYNALFDDATDDLENINSNLQLVENDWIILLDSINEYRSALERGSSDAEIKLLGIATLERVNINEELFDKLQFNKKIDQFVLKQQNRVTSLEEIREQLVSNFTNTLSILVPSIIIIGLLFSVYISRTISKPINILRTNARKIAEGDYDVDVRTDSTGEILELQKDIKKMAISLSEGFENKVKLKIAEQRELEYKKVEKQKDEFSAMVTHELKTPLTPILSWCGLFKKGILGSMTDKQKKGIDKIESNAHKLKNLLNDMLDSEKSHMEQMTFTFVKFNSSEFIQELVDNYQETMDQSNI